MRGCTGTAYLDDLQLEQAEAASTYNLLQNASFEFGDAGWNLQGGSAAAADTRFGAKAMTMQGSYGVNIYNTAYILIVAYLVKYQLMGMRTVVSAMSQIHVSLEESSTISGANWLKTMTKITGPLIFPSIAAGWFLIFIPCFYELSMTTLLYSNTTKTIGFQLYEYWTYTSQPQACAMAFGILMVVVLLNTLLNRITRGEFSI